MISRGLWVAIGLSLAINIPIALVALYLFHLPAFLTCIPTFAVGLYLGLQSWRWDQ